jgi:hypothetical protein
LHRDPIRRRISGQLERFCEIGVANSFIKVRAKLFPAPQAWRNEVVDKYEPVGRPLAISWSKFESLK